MENMNLNNQYDNSENKKKKGWRDVGIAALSLFIAALTVFVINI